MGIVFHGVPQELVLNLKQEYGLEVFVETGTFKGGTAVWAANNFKKVITTEFSQRFYDATKNQYGHIKNIDFLFGNSTEELKKILSSVQETCIFWLDAHWMGGGGTYGENYECPLLEELQIIKNSKLEHFILIDDARYFLSPPPKPHKIEQWPTLTDVIQTLQKNSERYTVVVHDVIVSVPSKARKMISQYSQDFNTKEFANYLQAQKTQAALAETQKQLTKKHEELVVSQSQQQKTEVMLEESVSQLQESMELLEQLNNEVDETVQALEVSQKKNSEQEKELAQTKSKFHDVREELERSQSQLDEVLGELEQTHFELHQLKEKGGQQQPESDGKVKQELEKTQAKLQETQKLLEESQYQKEPEELKGKWQETQQQLDKTKSELHDVREELERSQSQLDEVLGELEQTHFELHQLKEKGGQQQSKSDGKVKQKLEETKAKLQETEKLLEESESQLGEAMDVLEQYKSQMEKTMVTLEESQKELHQVKEQLGQKQPGTELELKKELDETKSQLQETEELLEKYKSQLEETMATLEDSFSKLDNNQKELEQTKFELHQVQQNAKTQPSSFELTPEKLAQTKSQVNQIVTGLNQLFEPLQLKLELSPDKTQTTVDIKHFPTQPPKRKQSLSLQKSQDLKTKSRRESIVVAGVTMFKDEQDIAYHNLVWHYNQGIERFVVLDNMSSDNTPQEVKRFADDYPDTQVYLIEDPEVGYYQSRKMTAAAEFAHQMWGAEWILPFDADEILCSFRAPLHTILESIPKEHICIQLPYKVHLLRSFYDNLEPNPFKRITHRLKGDIDKGAKVIIRWQSGMVIGQGNHNVTIDGNFLPITNNKNLGLIFRHYPFRSQEHIRQKVINGGKAYESAKDLPQNQGGAWKQWDSEYKIKGEKKIEEMYNSQVEGFPDAIYDPAII